MNTLMKKDSLSDMLTEVEHYQVIKNEDIKFLLEHREHLNKVFDNVHQWRSQAQKESIIFDENYPTTHSKFHQAINEQRVQLDQAFYLAKNYEEHKLDIEQLEAEIEEMIDFSISKMEKIQKKKKLLEIQFKRYEMHQIEISMKWRMAEVKGWQEIEERLLKQMKEEGMEEEAIWSKEKGETEFMFFQFLTNLKGIQKTTDGGEYNNLVSLARFGVAQAKRTGMFEQFVKQCNNVQLEALSWLGEIQITKREAKKEETIIKD